MENKEIFVKDIVNICNAELVCGNKNEICKKHYANEWARYSSSTTRFRWKCMDSRI